MNIKETYELYKIIYNQEYKEAKTIIRYYKYIAELVGYDLVNDHKDNVLNRFNKPYLFYRFNKGLCINHKAFIKYCDLFYGQEFI